MEKMKGDPFPSPSPHPPSLRSPFSSINLFLFSVTFISYLFQDIRSLRGCSTKFIRGGPPRGWFLFMNQVTLSLSHKGNKTIYRIFSIKRPQRLFKIRQFWPGVFSRPAFNRGPAFINEMRFSAIFPGWFIITDPRKPRGSLSVLDDFSLDYPKLQYYGTVHTARVPCCNQDLYH